MADDFETFFNLPAFERRVLQGAVAGLDEGAAALEATAKASRAYADQTGAKRASTVAYVAGAGVQSSARVQAAIAEAEDRNPAHVLVQDVGSAGEHEIAVVLTDFMDYSEHLEVKYGGKNASLGPAFDAHAPQLTASAAAGIGRMLGG